MTQSHSLRRFVYLSILAAVLTIGLKTGAYFITGSVGLLSDALESVVNLAAAFMALAMISVAERPPDDEHTFGHSKAEYFSSGVEGALIVVAALTIKAVVAGVASQCVGELGTADIFDVDECVIAIGATCEAACVAAVDYDASSDPVGQGNGDATGCGTVEDKVDAACSIQCVVAASSSKRVCEAIPGQSVSKLAATDVLDVDKRVIAVGSR